MSLINEAVKIRLKEMSKTKGQKRAAGQAALCVFNWTAFYSPRPNRPVSATYLTSSTVLLIFNFRKILAL